jgi:hypothetical protein
LSIAGRARAGDSSDAEAGTAVLRREANADLINGRPASAVEKYQAIYDQTHEAAMLYNICRAYEMMGDAAKALDALERFDTEASNDTKKRVPKLAELFASLRGRTTTLDVTSNVEGATARLRGIPLGTTPLKQTRVTSGTATLELSREGYFTSVGNVVLPGGGSARVEMNLAPTSTMALLHVTSSVTGTTVSLDGAAVGNTPADLPVAPGPHEVMVRAAGYRDSRVRVVVQAGDSRSLPIDLAKDTPLYGQWWFWGAVGATLVASAATVFIVTRERSPGEGTLPPGKLAVGLW